MAALIVSATENLLAGRLHLQEHLSHEIAGLEYFRAGEPVEDLEAFSARLDYPLVAHDSQVLGDVSLASAHCRHDLPGGELTLPQDGDDLQPGRAGQGLTDVGVQDEDVDDSC